MEIDIQITGKIIEKLRKGDEMVVGELQRAVKESSELVQEKMSDNAPKNIGRLRQSIKRELFTLSAAIYPSVEYAKFVEYGTQPHWLPRYTWQPGGPIYRWAKKHGIPPYLVARAIARKGTRAQPFVAKTADENKKTVEENFDDALKRIVNNLGD